MDGRSTLRSLEGVRLREAEPADAEALLSLKRRLDRETRFMLLEPDERNESAHDAGAALERIARSSNSVVVVAETGDGMVGYVAATGGAYRRNRATAHVVIGVLAAASGQGVGGALLDRLDAWARDAGLHRLELTVMASNQRALRLYERKGFVREGRRRECLRVDGALIDEFSMGKLL